MSATPNERQGTFAVEIVADVHDLVVDEASAEWYDAVDPSTGTKYECKSTHKTLDSGATGRYRLWYDQHRRLAGRDGQPDATAWYAFVLLDDSGDVVDVVRRKPSTVTTIVHEAGGAWNRAGHHDRGDGQHKVPWRQVHNR